MSIEEGATERTFGHDPHDTVVVLDLTPANPSQEVKRELLRRSFPSNTDVRLKAFFERHFASPNSRLMEGIFAFGREQVQLMVVLTKTGVNAQGQTTYEVANSFARFEVSNNGA